MRDPNERLTTRQAAEEFGVPASTLWTWRGLRDRDARYPRFHKLFTGKVYYVRGELAADLAGMEVVA